MHMSQNFAFIKVAKSILAFSHSALTLHQFSRNIVIAVLCWFVIVLVPFTDEQVQEHYDDFFEEIFVELEEKVKVTFIS